MAQNGNNIINHWSFLAFARQFGANVATGECTNHATGEIFKACTFTKDGKRTFVHFGPSLGEGLSLQEMVQQRDGLQVVQMAVSAEDAAVRKAAGKQEETYVLCKVGEGCWQSIDLSNYL